MAKILILCVSLKDSKTRQDNISHQIQILKQTVSDIQIDFHFFEAVYGKKLPPEYLSFIDLRRQFSGLCEHALGPSEIGCFLSHMILWQRHAQGNYTQYDRIIIIEDDVIFNFNQIHEKLISLIETNPSFAFLGGHSQPSRRRIRGYTSQDQLYFNTSGPKDLYTATFAYSLTREQARIFIDKQIKRLTYIDDWKYLLQKHTTVPFYFCFEHDDEIPSSIASDRQNFMKKPNRFKKNYRKIRNDLVSRIISLFLFKKIIRLSTFIAASNNRLNIPVDNKSKD
ncbi:glycosyltransferase family 25 protein [Acinetobacter pittii]|uniref:glycosyltransferase family 25 protein n=1 Tax=Acinetobacter pittii TaxID=48296 RepID=UPI001EFDE6FF|nr:glycosyltransferase family 25 protein [Acinetobacter pittii]MCG9511849.1 glycosyltransferase family 25 protein [Acinetobacter pittii]